MTEFGISLGAPRAEPMGDRHDYYRDLLQRGAGTFSSAWLSDHLMKDDAPILEAWTALTWLAAEFPNYHFGNLVLSQSYRNPALLAKMAATFQYLSGGRLILGIGAGWQADEYLAYGYPFPSAGTRVAQLSEAIDVLRALWTAGPATYEGIHYQIHEAWCEPRPTPLIPILIGGHRPKLMQVVAAKADLWQWDGPIERYRPPYDALVAACGHVGRDLSSIRLSTFAEVHLPADPRDFAAARNGTVSTITEAQDPTGLYTSEADWILGPTPDDAIRGLTPLIELGVTQVTVYFHDRRSLDRFAREVVPAVS